MNDRWQRVKHKVGVGAVASVAAVSTLGMGWYVYQTTPAPLDAGVVVDRDFTPAHWEEETRTRQVYAGEDCSGIGVDRRCTSQYRTEYYTVDVWYDDDWDLRIDGCSDNRRGDTICRADWVDVSQSVYDDCQVSERWRERTACRPQ